MSSLLRSWRSDRKDSGFTLRLRGVGWSCGECDLYIDADCADHVDGAKSEGQRCGHGEDGQVLDGKVYAASRISLDTGMTVWRCRTGEAGKGSEVKCETKNSWSNILRPKRAVKTKPMESKTKPTRSCASLPTAGMKGLLAEASHSARGD